MNSVAFPKYPSMERHDLTQGQLGSFKFTPVDVPRYPVDTRGDTPAFRRAKAGGIQRLEQIQDPATSSPDSITLRGPGTFLQMANHPSLGSLKYSQPSSAPSPLDTTFFNNHIKPDLEESRLKFGPATLRAAVDGSSPRKSLELAAQTLVSPGT
jgi:hypothetical protein